VRQHHARICHSQLEVSIRFAVIAATIAASLTFILPANGASERVLKHRETRQHRTIWRDTHTAIFFRNHPRLARTVIGRRAARFARLELAWTRRELHDAEQERRAHALRSLSVPQVICYVFGPACSKALSVARCESGFSVYATNGQYHGIFQMGSGERARFGDGLDAWSQARAAYRYYRLAGWGPWQCA
jgi:hypothetical protein